LSASDRLVQGFRILVVLDDGLGIGSHRKNICSEINILLLANFKGLFAMYLSTSVWVIGLALIVATQRPLPRLRTGAQ